MSISYASFPQQILMNFSMFPLACTLTDVQSLLDSILSPNLSRGPSLSLHAADRTTWNVHQLLSCMRRLSPVPCTYKKRSKTRVITLTIVRDCFFSDPHLKKLPASIMTSGLCVSPCPFYRLSVYQFVASFCDNIPRQM